MVAQPFGDFAGIVFFIFLDADRLRRAGLAGRDVLGAGKRTRRGSLPRHPYHGIPDDVEIFRLERYAIAFFGHGQSTLLGTAAFEDLDQMRFHDDAVIGKIGHGMRKLQRRERVISLSDAD